MIDIQEQDDESFRFKMEEAQKNRLPYTIEDFRNNDSKISRFKNAFDGFFEKIKFKGCKSDNGSKEVIFEKNGTEITIDQLSTGEKQIVFRGAHLLRNINNIKDTVVFIDEPEISMHPKWELKILDYYKNLFRDSLGHQTSQLFFATHSQNVIKSAITQPPSCKIIVLSEENGNLSSRSVLTDFILSEITDAEINYHAFGIISVDFHIALYGYLQSLFKVFYSLSQEPNIKQTDTYIINDPHYNATIHGKSTSFNSTNYQALTTAVRNSIDHPNTSVPYTQEELETSTKLLLEMIPNIKVAIAARTTSSSITTP